MFHLVKWRPISSYVDCPIFLNAQYATDKLSKQQIIDIFLIFPPKAIWRQFAWNVKTWFRDEYHKRHYWKYNAGLCNSIIENGQNLKPKNLGKNVILIIL